MKFEDFRNLYGVAVKFNDDERFIAELGWQEWMNDNVLDCAVSMMRDIFKLSRAAYDIKKLREINNLNRGEMSRKFLIPIRTLENWDSGVRVPAEYVYMLIAFTFFNEMQEVKNDTIK